MAESTLDFGFYTVCRENPCSFMTHVYVLVGGEVFLLVSKCHASGIFYQVYLYM